MHRARPARSKRVNSPLATAAPLYYGSLDAFNGRWLRRAWLDNITGWVGDLTTATPGIPRLGYEGVFSAQHGWAFAGGVFDGDGGRGGGGEGSSSSSSGSSSSALNVTLASLHRYCRKPYPYGYAYICGPLEDPHPPPLPQAGTGQSSSGGRAGGGNMHRHRRRRRRRLQFSDAPGMWAAINYPTVLGLLAINRTELAWEEYERNSQLSALAGWGHARDLDRAVD
jgi:hypothetical protein